MDYLRIYNLESYIFNEVRGKFCQKGKLDAFDFFCIIIWKANRAKSRIAHLLLNRKKQPQDNLNSVVEDLTSSIAKAVTDEEKMKILIADWGLRLPMASAILSVLYPNRFTLYDYRACDLLGNYHNIQNWKFERLWQKYLSFINDVKNSVSSEYSLRDKDRILWARSFVKQLEKDIINGFKSTDKK